MAQKLYLALAVFLALSVIATPIGTKSADFFTFHMIQHIVTMMIVGPCLVLATTEKTRNRLNQNQLFYFLTRIDVSFFIYAALMIGVHISPIHIFIMEKPWSHYLIELPLYLTVPYLFYFNLIEPKLSNRRVATGAACLVLWIMMIPETLTGFFIYVSKSSAYQNMYDINDQRLGGTIMWSGGMIIDTIWILLAVYHWYKSEELKNE